MLLKLRLLISKSKTKLKSLLAKLRPLISKSKTKLKSLLAKLRPLISKSKTKLKSLFTLKNLWSTLVYVVLVSSQLLGLYLIFKGVDLQFIYDSVFKEYFDIVYLCWDTLISPQVHTYSYDPAFHNATIRLHEDFPFRGKHGGMIRQAGWVFRDFACTVPLSWVTTCMVDGNLTLPTIIYDQLTNMYCTYPKR